MQSTTQLSNSLMFAHCSPKTTVCTSPFGNHPSHLSAANFFDNDWNVQPKTPTKIPITTHIELLMKSPEPTTTNCDHVLGLVMESYCKAAIDALVATMALEVEKK